MRYLIDRRLATLDDVSIPCGNLRYVGRGGEVLHQAPVGYRFTSWYALYARLLDRLPAGSMHFSQSLLDADVDADEVRVQLQGGVEERCDLLVCADGISSAGRRILLPNCEPVYAGYIGWRGTVPFTSVDTELRASVGPHITYQLLDAGHILAYPIPAADGDLWLNWIWYHRVATSGELTRTMTDRNGVEHALSVPPGAVAADVVEHIHEAAAQLLAPDLAALVLSTPQPFIQRVVDVEVSRMVAGRMVLLGDAAFVARPHAAAGTAKAAADGRRSPHTSGAPRTFLPRSFDGSPISWRSGATWCAGLASWATPSSVGNG